MQLDDMQLVCDYIMGMNNKCSIPVIRNNRWSNSLATISGTNKRIVMAEFIFSYSDEVQLAEIIHETCHFLCDNREYHGPQFRQKEIYWLSQFGLKPRFYKRAYYKCVETLNGKLIPIRDFETYKTASSQYGKLKTAAKTIKKRKHIERIEL